MRAPYLIAVAALFAGACTQPIKDQDGTPRNDAGADCWLQGGATNCEDSELPERDSGPSTSDSGPGGQSQDAGSDGGSAGNSNGNPCDACTLDQICNGESKCVPKTSDPCTPSSDSALCQANSVQCGPITAKDNCGATRQVASCGTCATGMSEARGLHRAFILSNGKIMVVGGNGNLGPTATTELYDPGSNSWASGGSLPRAPGAIVQLPDARLLAIGGSASAPAAGADIYETASNKWLPVKAAPTARGVPSAVVLSTGHVLVAGGRTPSGVGDTAIYDPGNNTWEAGKAMLTPRAYHSLIALPGGKALAVAGADWSNPLFASAEIFDESTLTWSSAGSIRAAALYTHAATLPDGSLLVFGGENGAATANADRFNPTTKEWTAAPSMMHARAAATSLTLADGRIWVGGGMTDADGTSHLTSAEIFDPETNTWSNAPPLQTGRAYGAAVLIADDVLLTGGLGQAYLQSVERFGPFL